MISRVGEGARKRFFRSGAPVPLRPVPRRRQRGDVHAASTCSSSTGPPSLRRRLLNAALSQCRPSVLSADSPHTRRSSRKRTRCSKPPACDRALLATYNEQLASVGSKHRGRARDLRPASCHARRCAVHARWVGPVAGTGVAVSYRHRRCRKTAPDAMAKRCCTPSTRIVTAELAGARRSSDRIATMFSSRSADEPFARFGSQGQQRTAVLAVKAAEYALLRARGRRTAAPACSTTCSPSSTRSAAGRSWAASTDLEQAFITATDVPDFHGARRDVVSHPRRHDRTACDRQAGFTHERAATAARRSSNSGARRRWIKAPSTSTRRSRRSRSRGQPRWAAALPLAAAPSSCSAARCSCSPPAARGATS